MADKGIGVSSATPPGIEPPLHDGMTDDTERSEVSASPRQSRTVTTGLTPASGYDGTLTWNTTTDMAGIDDSGVILRVTPSDTEDGTPDTLPFHIDNNAVPDLNAHGTAGTARDITVSFTLTDAESDDCSVIVEFSDDGGTSWNAATDATSTNSPNFSACISPA